MPFPQDNRTWRILHHAKEHNYAVGGFCVYNTDGIMAVIRAAEQRRSPAIIQLFPWTLHFQGPHFVQYAAQAARAASVPISLHLDHCMKASDIELALKLPFDSIMIDASSPHLDHNIRTCKDVVGRAEKVGIAIEAELGRIDGEEDGVPNVNDLEGMLTQPKDAEKFAKETGVHFLAPSFGNIHGGYGPEGPKKFWQLDRLATIRELVGADRPLVLHGTHGVSHKVLVEAMKAGVTKVNLNKTVRNEYGKFLTESCGSLELTKLQEKGVEIYASEIAALMDVLGSSWKV